MMKTFCKTLALVLTLLLALTALTACGKTPTPDEIYVEIDESSGAQIVMEMEIKSLLSMTMTLDVEGDKAHAVTDFSMFGQSSSEEVYTEKAGDKEYTYSKVDGKWTKTDNPVDKDGEMASVEFFKALFSTDNYNEYDKETSRYVMKEGVSVDLDGMECKNGYIELCEDGSYKIHCEITQAESDTTLEGTLDITFAKLGEVTVTLPTVE